ncbi:MAG: hypothetical protein JWL83_3902 [Actinomycetia bacterium]|nr:hypothetical protein [Actinomycetes bacterium]
MTGRRAFRVPFRVAAYVAGCLVAVTQLSGCGGSGHGALGGQAHVTVQPSQTFVVVGSAATVGDGLDQPMQQVWARLVWREAFPRSTIFVNAAVRDATAASALQDQVPLAAELHPATVAVWLGSQEAFDRVPVDGFATDLRAVLERLRATGARVFVGDVPQLGAVRADAYNAAIARVAADAGATLVPLHDLSVRRGDGDPVFVPNPAGHRAIADAFVAAIKGRAP